jgi:endonuclease/exonuclease/phosphatase family metal-dependent hydrolase
MKRQNILQRHLRPAALRSGIGKIGWHTFRHSYSTMLRGAGADIKVQQELLRHSTIQSTMNIYTQAVSEQKRAANSMVVGILFSEIASENQPPTVPARRVTLQFASQKSASGTHQSRFAMCHFGRAC